MGYDIRQRFNLADEYPMRGKDMAEMMARIKEVEVGYSVVAEESDPKATPLAQIDRKVRREKSDGV